MQDEALAERVAAVERAITDGETDLAGLADEAAAAQRLDDLADRVAELEDACDELEAATQALRGYVGNVRAVNQEVQGRADLALEKVEDLAANGPESAGVTAEAGGGCPTCGGERDSAEPGSGGEGAAEPPAWVRTDQPAPARASTDGGPAASPPASDGPGGSAGGASVDPGRHPTRDARTTPVDPAGDEGGVLERVRELL